jgi:ribosome-interacting GTPase 1
VKSILHEYRITNADVIFRCNAEVDDLIDVIEGDRKYIPCVYALNKIDEITIEELEILDKIPHYVPICAFKEWNLDELVEKIWEYLDLIRIYTKPKGFKPDYDMPVVCSRLRSTAADFCNRIHRLLLK